MQNLALNPLGGNVGIGTSNPASTLNISHTDAIPLRIARSTAGQTAIRLTNGGGNNLDITNDGSDNFTINNGGTERFRIDSAGNVGIGTDSPSATLDVSKNQNGHGITITQQNAGDGYHSKLTFRGSDGSGGFVQTAALAAYQTANGANGYLRFFSGNTEAMRITSGGVVEITNGIKLGGTAAANLLDDYEEGTWTPVLGGTWTTNPTNITGNYTKIGRQVTITMQFTGGVKSSSISGYFTGIPFNINKNGTGSVVDSAVTDYGNCLFANSDRVWFTATNLGSGTVYVTGTYFAS
jgi:hypothetical protein